MVSERGGLSRRISVLSEVMKKQRISSNDQVFFYFWKPKKRNGPFLFIFLLAEHHGYAVDIVLT